MGRTRRVFDKEFKAEAVRLARSGGRTVSEVAKSLQLNPVLLSRWLKAAETEGADAFRGRGNRTAVEEELHQLRQKNKQLEQELEFLKKVSRYFVKDPK